MNAKQLIRFSLIGLAALLPFSSCNAGNAKKSDSDSQPAPKSTVGSTGRIVCYFSATGTTAREAKRLVEIANADIYEIVPAEKYTAEDLDWRNKKSRSYIEMHDLTIRPKLTGEQPDLSKYKEVFIGFPNWWDMAPTVINTFIEANDLKGKKIMPFQTSGGSTIDNSVAVLKGLYPDLDWRPGLLMNGASDRDVKDWVEK